jgi:N-acetylneuraminate synthase
VTVSNSDISLGELRFGGNFPCLVITEVAQAHDGSLGAAHAFIDAAAQAGADAIKFQTHIAVEESTRAEPWRVRFSLQDETRYDYWKRMEFTEAQWLGLAHHALRVGLVFLSSPFSMAAVDLLERVGVPAWKVASGEVSNLPMIERMASTGKPVLLSSGMSGWQELDRAVEVVQSKGAPLAIFQCTTAYPAPPERVGLNVLAELRERYSCPVGLSDHSGAIFAGLAAATLGADMLEVHVTFSRQAFGPDVSASLTFDELADLVLGVKFIEKALGNPVDKDAEEKGAEELRTTFGKSVVAARDLSKGTVITSEDLAAKKPGWGIPAVRLSELVGRTLLRDLAADEMIREEHLG